jgi:hypothetical protein
MKTFVDEHWSLSIPDEWLAERYPECVSLYQPDGMGELQISASLQQHPVILSELRELAAEHIAAGAFPHSVRLGDFDGFTLSYGVDDEYWCEWYLKSGRILLFATYGCAADDEGKEDDVVEAILETLGTRQTKGG